MTDKYRYIIERDTSDFGYFARIYQNNDPYWIDSTYCLTYWGAKRWAKRWRPKAERIVEEGAL